MFRNIIKNFMSFNMSCNKMIKNKKFISVYLLLVLLCFLALYKIKVLR